MTHGLEVLWNWNLTYVWIHGKSLRSTKCFWSKYMSLVAPTTACDRVALTFIHGSMIYIFNLCIYTLTYQYFFHCLFCHGMISFHKLEVHIFLSGSRTFVRGFFWIFFVLSGAMRLKPRSTPLWACWRLLMSTKGPPDWERWRGPFWATTKFWQGCFPNKRI